MYKQLADKKRSFVYVLRKAEPDKAAALQKRALAGVAFYPEERRFYPQGSVASHILGYAGVDNRGLAGLELRLDVRAPLRVLPHRAAPDAFEDGDPPPFWEEASDAPAGEPTDAFELKARRAHAGPAFA